jgi:hypothetical protein
MPARKDLSEEHTWVAAAEVPIAQRIVAGAYRRGAAQVEEATWVKVLDVYCAYCRRTFESARDVPCDKAGSVLRGGPNGTRRRPVDLPIATEATRAP